MLAGFCVVEVVGVAPGKYHFHEVGVLVDKSVKLIHCPTQSVESDAEKLATGTGPEVGTIS